MIYEMSPSKTHRVQLNGDLIFFVVNSAHFGRKIMLVLH